jgi:hypothetical protein
MEWGGEVFWPTIKQSQPRSRHAESVRREAWHGGLDQLLMAHDDTVRERESGFRVVTPHPARLVLSRARDPDRCCHVRAMLLLHWPPLRVVFHTENGRAHPKTPQ